MGRIWVVQEEASLIREAIWAKAQWLRKCSIFQELWGEYIQSRMGHFFKATI